MIGNVTGCYHGSSSTVKLVTFFTNVIARNEDNENEEMQGNVTCCYHGCFSTVTQRIVSM